ncbi:unnamed protein product [Symbiodinium sp. CCMP2592]|nr:unnamed protein product [Symbiodinium sp. CCMP2592]
MSYDPYKIPRELGILEVSADRSRKSSSSPWACLELASTTTRGAYVSSHAPVAPTPWSRALARFCWPRFAARQPCGRALPTALGRTPQITACAALTGAWRWRTIQTRAEVTSLLRTLRLCVTTSCATLCTSRSSGPPLPLSCWPSATGLVVGCGVRMQAHLGRAWVQLHDGWPYIQVELDLDHGGLLLDGGSWTFAFGLKNASTVHYRGDERTRGYDVCCDFVQDSQCQRRPASNISGPEPKCPKDSATDCHEGISNSNSLYTISDCPLPPLVTASVRRPLHLNMTGQWGAALQVKDASGEEVACVAFALAHSMQQTEPATESTLAGSPGGASGLGLDGVGTDNATHQRGASEGPPEVSFQHIGSGQFCEDGGDLLEGALDDYGGLSPFGGARRASAESSMFYGSKCRERCRRKMNCRFYTAYSSGWCQLSSRCALARAGDPLTENPDVLEIGDGMIEEWCLSSGLERSRAPGPEHSSDEPDLEAFGEFDPEARQTLGTLLRLSGRSWEPSHYG